MRARPSYSTIASTLALVVALGSGGAYAAGLAKNSVGSKQIKNGAIKALDLAPGVIPTGGGGTAVPADGSVTTPKLADGAVVPAKLADGSVTSTKLADGSVTSTKLGDGQVATATVADSAITSAKVADSAITSAKIADGAIGTGDVADNTLLLADLQRSSANFAVTLANGTALAPGGCTSRAASDSDFLPAGKLATVEYTSGTIPDNIALFASTTKEQAGVGQVGLLICNTSSSATATFTGASFIIRVRVFD